MPITIGYDVPGATIGAAYAAGVGKGAHRRNELAAKQRQAELDRLARERSQLRQLGYATRRDALDRDFTARRDLFGELMRGNQNANQFHQKKELNKDRFEHEGLMQNRVDARQESQLKHQAEQQEKRWAYQSKQTMEQEAAAEKKARFNSAVERYNDQYAALTKHDPKGLTQDGRGLLRKFQTEKAKLNEVWGSGEMKEKDYLNRLYWLNEKMRAAKLEDHLIPEKTIKDILSPQNITEVNGTPYALGPDGKPFELSKSEKDTSKDDLTLKLFEIAMKKKTAIGEPAYTMEQAWSEAEKLAAKTIGSGEGGVQPEAVAAPNTLPVCRTPEDVAELPPGTEFTVPDEPGVVRRTPSAPTH